MTDNPTPPPSEEEDAMVQRLAELLGPDVTITVEGDDVHISKDVDAVDDMHAFNKMVDLAIRAAMIAAEDDDGNLPEAPPRGTKEYRDVIRHVVNLDELTPVVHSITGLWHDYGWRGPLDLMTEWVIQMDRHPQASPERNPHLRDMFGVLDLSRLVKVDQDQEHSLKVAATQVQDPNFRKGVPRHEAFARAVELMESTTGLARAWLPTFREAFRAAQADQDRRRAVFAALVKGPERTVERSLIHMAILLGTAAMGLRHYEDIQQRYRTVAKARGELIGNRDITPDWGLNFVNAKGREDT